MVVCFSVHSVHTTQYAIICRSVRNCYVFAQTKSAAEAEWLITAELFTRMMISDWQVSSLAYRTVPKTINKPDFLSPEAEIARMTWPTDMLYMTLAWPWQFLLHPCWWRAVATPRCTRSWRGRAAVRRFPWTRCRRPGGGHCVPCSRHSWHSECHCWTSSHREIDARLVRHRVPLRSDKLAPRLSASHTPHAPTCQCNCFRQSVSVAKLNNFTVLIVYSSPYSVIDLKCTMLYADNWPIRRYAC